MLAAIDALFVPIVTGFACGLVTYGGIRVHLAWIRADVARAHARIDRIIGAG